MPERVKEKINDPDIVKNVPIMQEYEVYQKLSNKKIKNSSVPGDIPSKLKKEFLPEITKLNRMDQFGNNRSEPIISLFLSSAYSYLFTLEWRKSLCRD